MAIKRSRKWFFLLLVIWLPGLVYPLLFTQEQFWYITLLVFLTWFAILANCHQITIYLHQKPYYIEDLKDETTVDQTLRDRYQKRFVVGVAVMMSFFATALVDYYLYRYQDTSLSALEILFLMGGGANIYSMAHATYGSLLLAWLKYCKTAGITTQIPPAFEELSSGALYQARLYEETPTASGL